jgi:hypothetical protein
MTTRPATPAGTERKRNLPGLRGAAVTAGKVTQEIIRAVAVK